ncbi:SdiA-regulated domain-containing protein [Azomonas macrocytogenes]|uniref:Uncharacterized protein YjiK n=1 Tax=Azomonas macrocytogenes TaxID=69962 RepID=A0A839T3W7_AZOMA|nr:SdiA-regulated domain-containing protein [Azomonas macrocytogenes]MBB3103410.1 uncharacterized protein YjiK [Azomonas macrocytogenes]
MRFAFNLKSSLAVFVLLGVLLSITITAQKSRLFERAWFNLREWRHADDWQARSLWLPDYRVVVEGRKIEGIDENLSALTYDPDRKSLFAITNGQPRIVELALDGRLLRSIELVGFSDCEAIEYIAPGVYVVANEREQRLLRVTLDDDTRSIDASHLQQITLGIDNDGSNKGFEALGYDRVRQRLFVGKERDPVRIYEIDGFPFSPTSKARFVHVNENRRRDARLFVRDLSSLSYDQGSGHLLVLSDESRLVLELDAKNRPVSTLSLSGGQHGLRYSVPQAEGLTIDEEGSLYIVSEPNLFYVFKKTGQNSD